MAHDYNSIAGDMVQRARTAGHDVIYNASTLPTDAPVFNPTEIYTVVSPPVGRAISVYFQLLILVIKELNIKLKGIVLS